MTYLKALSHIPTEIIKYSVEEGEGNKRKSLRLKEAHAQGKVRSKSVARFTIPTKIGYKRFMQSALKQPCSTQKPGPGKESEQQLNDHHELHLDENLPPFDGDDADAPEQERAGQMKVDFNK